MVALMMYSRVTYGYFMIFDSTSDRISGKVLLTGSSDKQDWRYIADP
jgi:hypothetical protein